MGTLPTEVSSGHIIQPGKERLIVDLKKAAEVEIDISKGGFYALFTQHTPEEFDLILRDVNGNKVTPIQEHYFTAGHTHDDTVSSVALECAGDLIRRNSMTGFRCCYRPRVQIFFE